ncbi:hypothetical protein HMPREF0975_00248 [Actinomyces sp. oral taxon 849 str. F0330]|nr:hypothetical protein HMPREF0975_00248 [Actinomyces sp. oral taxon 849 str. F0330]
MVSPYPRKVKTASGATAVQVVIKDNGVRRIVEHLGSAHDEAKLAALMRLGHQLLAGQQVLDLLAEVVMRPVGSRVTVVRCEGL